MNNSYLYFGLSLLAYYSLGAKCDDIVVSVEDGIRPLLSCVGATFYVNSSMKVIAMTHVKNLNLLVFIAREQDVSEIYAVPLEGAQTPTKLLKPEIVQSHILEDIAALDNGTVFVSDASLPAILRVELSSFPALSAHLSVFVELEREDRPRGLAVDTGSAQSGPALVWVNWRFGHQSIRRVPLGTGGRGAALVAEGLYLPQGVAVDSARRLLYYSQLTEHSSRLQVREASADNTPPRGGHSLPSPPLYEGDWHNRSRGTVSLLRLSTAALYWTDGAGLWRRSRLYLSLVVGDGAPSLVAPGATAFCVLPANSLCANDTADSDTAGLAKSDTADSDTVGLAKSDTADSDTVGLAKSDTADSDTAGLAKSDTADSDTVGLAKSNAANSTLELSTGVPISSVDPSTSSVLSQPSCPQLWCLNGGTCYVSETSADQPGAADKSLPQLRCLCRSGFTGARCGEDRCRQRCLNGGICRRPSLVLSASGQEVEGEVMTSVMRASWSADVDCVCPMGVSGDRCQYVSSDSPPVNCSVSLPLHMTSSQVVTALSVLAVTVVFLLLLLLCVAVGRRRVAAALLRRRGQMLISAERGDKQAQRRRVMGGASTARVVLKSCSLAAVESRRRDIEDCCGMTLCERPCEVRVKSGSGASRLGRSSRCPAIDPAEGDEDTASGYNDQTSLLLTVATVRSSGKAAFHRL